MVTWHVLSSPTTVCTLERKRTQAALSTRLDAMKPVAEELEDSWRDAALQYVLEGR